MIPERRAASVTAAACKASAGAVEHLPVARVRNLADWLASARDDGAWIYGADAEAEAAYTTLDLSGRVVLVLGGEGGGLRPRVAAGCDALVRIPTDGEGRLAQRLGRRRRAAVRRLPCRDRGRGSSSGAPGGTPILQARIAARRRRGLTELRRGVDCRASNGEPQVQG